MGDSNLVIQTGKRNRFLALLPAEDYEELLSPAITVSLPLYRELYSDGRAVDAIYFPLNCVVSIMVGAGDGEPRVEMATIGNEGVVGVYSMLKKGRAIGSHVIQLAGDALRIPAENFQVRMRSSPRFEEIVRHYMYALTRQIVQAGACHRLHTMEERCARWLLMLHDRAGKDTFSLTQEFLAEMIGVRRATVNLATGILKNAGFIRYVRGQITVLDRPGLASASCPCYELIRKEFEEQ